MNQVFKPGDIMTTEHVVSEQDIAAFESGVVHRVYSTFSLGRDAEWACRLFVLEMKESDEEGIGTFLHVEHVSPALLNSRVQFEAMIEAINGNEIICSYTAKVGERLVAKGRQGQKIIKKDKLDKLFNSLK